MNIKVDLNSKIGTIKPMHGVGQPPFSGVDFSMFKYLTDAGIPYSRLHDVGGKYGGNRWVDIPNVFRNFNADPYDPASYDFTFTDLMITALIESGVEPFFRLGVTIENECLIKAYYIYPPADYHKWAVICEHIIRHYTEGWADGFRYDIKYWEIWNEPDNYEDIYENQMWRGTKEQYYELYGVASKHLKSCFPHLKIGGYASCGFYLISGSYVSWANSSDRFDYFIEFLDGFLDYVKENDCPFDFFSWHSYDSVENNIMYASYAKDKLASYGFGDTETTLNEWNCEVNTRGTAHHAALTCAMMLGLQDTPLDSAMFYDAQLGMSVYGSMFNCLTREPYPTYYAFTAYNELYKLKEQVAVEVDADGVYAVAAAKDGQSRIVVANVSGEDKPMIIECGGKVVKYVVTDECGNEQELESLDVLKNDSFAVIFIEY